MTRETGRGKLVAQNKKARHDYDLMDTYACGIVLTGTEVKSLRAGHANLIDGFAHIREGEAFLAGVHIPEYTEGTWNNHTPRRARKLLLHKAEIIKLTVKLREGGLALVPLQLYFMNGHAKVELGLGKGRKSYDKRQVLAERDADNEMRRAQGRYAKGRR